CRRRGRFPAGGAHPRLQHGRARLRVLDLQRHPGLGAREELAVARERVRLPAQRLLDERLVLPGRGMVWREEDGVRERLAGLFVAAEGTERLPPIAPGARMFGFGCDRAVEGVDRFGEEADLRVRRALAVPQLGIAWRLLE